MNKIFSYIFIIFTYISFGQELNCNVVVNATQTGDENLQIFKTLETQISDFINNTNWTNNSFTSKQRINCSMVINISNYDNDTFQGTIQIQSSRPIFNSSYESSVYNYIDKDFSFKYQEFQNFVFNPTQFESNLISASANGKSTEIPAHAIAILKILTAGKYLNEISVLFVLKNGIT